MTECLTAVRDLVIESEIMNQARRLKRILVQLIADNPIVEDVAVIAGMNIIYIRKGVERQSVVDLINELNSIESRRFIARKEPEMDFLVSYNKIVKGRYTLVAEFRQHLGRLPQGKKIIVRTLKRTDRFANGGTRKG